MSTEGTPQSVVSKRLLKIKYYKGMPLRAVYRDEHLEALRAHVPADGDVILNAYPKTGNTWMVNILWQILHKAKPFENEELFRYRFDMIPLLERSGTARLECMSPPRLYRTHFPCNLLKINPKAKYVITFRHPEDVVVSFYHYLKTNEYIASDFSDFFDDFVNGKCFYGNYFAHLRAANAYKDSGNFLFVSYEQLLNDTKEQILKIAEFLGDEHYRALYSDGCLLTKILEVTSFNYMKEHSLFTIVPNHLRESEFEEMFIYRKGVSGDGKSLLTGFQSRMLRDKAMEELDGTDFITTWYA